MTDEVKRDQFGASEYWVSEDDGSICLSDMDGSGGSIDECEVAKRLNEGVRLSAARAREIEAKDEEIRRLRECPDCGGDKVVAEIARRMGHRPDVAFAAVMKAEAALATSREEISRMKDWAETARIQSVEIRRLKQEIGTTLTPEEAEHDG